MPDDLIRRTDAKAAIDYADCDKGGFTKGTAKKAIDSVPAAGAGELESEIRSLIDDYRDSVAQEAGKNDTGDETLGLVILDLEKLIAADLTSRPDAAKREE